VTSAPPSAETPIVKRPPDDSDPRVQLRATERLDQVVVGAGLENGDDLRIAVAGGGDDDGDVVDRP
jgi:hypothetical protein